MAGVVAAATTETWARHWLHGAGVAHKQRVLGGAASMSTSLGAGTTHRTSVGVGFVCVQRGRGQRQHAINECGGGGVRDLQVWGKEWRMASASTGWRASGKGKAEVEACVA
jgi:hypothetical protein